ncbi:hypothetical protein Golob_011508, partial [Gossypium lobatum]|nr:hypothetical protein [Gossypium lobatum]
MTLEDCFWVKDALMEAKELVKFDKKKYESTRCMRKSGKINVGLADHYMKMGKSMWLRPIVRYDYMNVHGVMVKVNMLGGMMPGIRQGSGDSDYYAYSGLFGKVTYCKIM